MATTVPIPTAASPTLWSKLRQTARSIWLSVCFRELARGTTALLISHRFATVRIGAFVRCASRIVAGIVYFENKLSHARRRKGGEYMRRIVLGDNLTALRELA
ncbi:MAG: hypothetical protein ACRDHE_13140, partial [Ktedonobacterales bacterium]